MFNARYDKCWTVESFHVDWILCKENQACKQCRLHVLVPRSSIKFWVYTQRNGGRPQPSAFRPRRCHFKGGLIGMCRIPCHCRVWFNRAAILSVLFVCILHLIPFAFLRGQTPDAEPFSRKWPETRRAVAQLPIQTWDLYLAPISLAPPPLHHWHWCLWRFKGHFRKRVPVQIVTEVERIWRESTFMLKKGIQSLILIAKFLRWNLFGEKIKTRRFNFHVCSFWTRTTIELVKNRS